LARLWKWPVWTARSTHLSLVPTMGVALGVGLALVQRRRRCTRLLQELTVTEDSMLPLPLLTDSDKEATRLMHAIDFRAHEFTVLNYFRGSW